MPQTNGVAFWARAELNASRPRLLVSLAPPSRSGDPHGLECLAQDATFGWAPPDNDTSDTDSDFDQSLEPENTGGSTLTSAQPSAPVRHVLREIGFDLVSSGVPVQSSTSPESPNFLRGFGDVAMTEPFHEAAERVDEFLAAVDRLRGRHEDHLRALFVERAGWTRPWKKLLEKLEIVFGGELNADFVVQTPFSVGKSLDVDRDHPSEGYFNRTLSSSVVTATNSILMLIGMANGASEAAAGMTTTTASASDQVDADLGAAHLLIHAIACIEQGRWIRFVQPLSKNLLPPSLAVAWANARPDWILVGGLGGRHDVYGVVEGKPRAAPHDCERLALHRLDPLGPEHYERTPPADGSTAPPPAPVQDDEGPRRSSRLAQSSSDGTGPPSYLDEPDTPEQKRIHRDIANDPDKSPHFGYVTYHDWQRLQLQLAWQMASFNVRQALVWGDWSKSLVAAQLRRASPEEQKPSGGDSQWVLDFAPHALHAPLAISAAGPAHLGHPQPPPSPPPPPPPPPPSSSSHWSLVWRSAPNVALGLVQWALQAHRDWIARGTLVEGSAIDLPSVTDQAAAPSRAEPPTLPDQPRRKDGRERTRPGDGTGFEARGRPKPSTTAAVDGPPSEERPTESGSHFFWSPPSGGPAQRPPTSPDEPSPRKAEQCATPPDSAKRHHGAGEMRVELLPFARGSFADVYRALLVAPGRQEAKRFVYKVNRPAHKEGQGPLAQLAAQQRFEWEHQLLEQLKHLQGGMLPALWGTSTAKGTLVLPEGASKALILEDAGLPIDAHSAWPSSTPLDERRRLVEEAYATLHGAGFCHGDVAPRNVLVSCDRHSESTSMVTGAAASASSSANAASTAARICIVDLADAYPCRPGVPSDEEAARLRKMLDGLYGPAPPASLRPHA